MQTIGNKKCNLLYEARAPEKKINPESSSYVLTSATVIRLY